LTIILGKNGAGKTNLLESIFMLATAKSPKSRYDSDVINMLREFATVNGEIQSDGENVSLELQVIRNPDRNNNISSKKTRVNKTVKSITYFTGIFNAVFFTPQDIEVITGSPGARRKYLDLILIQNDRGYKKAISDYTKALRQRNKLLEIIRIQGSNTDQMPFWDNILTQTGTIIQNSRSELIDFLNFRLPKLISTLDSPKTEVYIKYKKNEITRERLDAHLQADLRAQTTLIGPHRDDFLIQFNESDLGQFGSRGQQRAVLLALKLLEIDFSEQKKGHRPVLLLDDIFSELDDTHRKAVLDVINKQQTIITSAEELQELEPKLAEKKPQIIRL
jgi:DNA replication and repair protein RecF